MNINSVDQDFFQKPGHSKIANCLGTTKAPSLKHKHLKPFSFSKICTQEKLVFNVSIYVTSAIAAVSQLKFFLGKRAFYFIS